MSKKPVANLKPMSKSIAPNRDASAMLNFIADPAPPSAVPSYAQPAVAPDQAPLGPIITADGVSGLHEGVVYDLPLGVLEKSENNARVFYRQSEIDEMAADIAGSGQEVAAIGFVRGKRVVIVDGQKRFTACVAGSIPTLRVQIRKPPESDAEEYAISRTINIRRSAQTAFDDAVRWQELLQRGVYADQEDLAQKLGVSQATVSKTIGLNRIPIQVRRMLAESEHCGTLPVAYAISCVYSDKSGRDKDALDMIVEDVASEAIKRSLTVNQIIDLVRSKIEGPRSRTRGEVLPIHFSRTKGALKVVPSRGELTLTFKGLDPRALDDLRERLQQAVAQGPQMSLDA